MELANIDAGLIFGRLPIEWLTFEGHFIDKYVELNWSTGIELNNAHFIVERRLEGDLIFSPIGHLSPAIFNNHTINKYKFEDHDVAAGKIYHYRIRQVDLDGSFTLSELVTVVIPFKDLHSIRISPNPANNFLNLEYQGLGNSTIKLEIFNLMGVSVWNLNDFYCRENDVQEMKLDLQGLLPGNYILQLRTDRLVERKSFVISRN